ncbi:MAG: polyprenyl glycosylphosphotransferase [Leifsonia xyli]|nr:MAG: polyprenyl glycosylphosphotransferase [Leifsonia xyli]
MSSATHPWVGTGAASADPRLSLAVAPARSRDHASPGRRAMRRYRAALALSDGLIVTLCVGISLLVRFGTEPVAVDVAGFAAGYWALGVVIAAAWFIGLGTYHSRDLRIIGSGPAEYRKVVGATTTVFGLAAIVLLLLKVDVARGFFLLAFPLGLLGLLLGRWLARRALVRLRRAGRCTNATLVVGARADVQRVLATLSRDPGSMYRPVGVALDNPGVRELTIRGKRTVPVIGTLDDVAGTVRRHHVDTVIVAGQPHGGGDFIRSVGWELERTEAELMIASRLTDVAGPRIHFRPAEGLPLMHVELPSYEGGKHVVKRVFDLTVAAVALVVLAPVFAVVAIVIRRHDGGPVLFRQERVGRSGRTFSMYKFRSMVLDAEARLAELKAADQGNGVLFKLREDPRITAPGRILRKYSLDELPQLWNVLLGDMSLVGPRPPLASEVDQYEDHVLRRLFIKPGLTGMWQINGRSDLSWEDSVRLDLYYVENWSLTGDLLILWRTARIVLRPSGAY